jgi:uncharacterized membrane protein (UPF0182 family)
VQLSSLWRKLLFALRFGSYQIVLNDGITTESRILFNRNIRERVERIAPFLSFDRDPYLVLAEGRSTGSSMPTRRASLPYSTPAGAQLHPQLREVRRRCLRRDDHGVPLRRQGSDRGHLRAIFPNTFKPLSEMPASLREHVRYPEDIFAIQAQVYATYHMTQPAVYYNREDQWEIPTVDEATTNAHAAVLHDHAAAGREGRRVHPDAAVHAAAARQPRRVAGRAQRRRALRTAGVFEFPKQKLVFGPGRSSRASRRIR